MSNSPFVTSLRGHPNFTPLKPGSKPGLDKDTRTPKSLDRSCSRGRSLLVPSQNQTEGKVTYQEVEDEKENDEISTRHAAYARFVRNNLLINVIFSNAVVPDVRSVVTVSRMKMMKNNLHFLSLQKKKVEVEMKRMEEKFETKKRKFLEASKTFQEELDKCCSVDPVDPATFQEMVDKAYRQLKEKQDQNEELARKRNKNAGKKTSTIDIQPVDLNQAPAQTAPSHSPHNTEITITLIPANSDKSDDREKWSQPQPSQPFLQPVPETESKPDWSSGSLIHV